MKEGEVTNTSSTSNDQYDMRLIIEEEEDKNENKVAAAHHQRTQRVASLDIFRGLTVAGHSDRLKHWVVMGLFLLVVGVVLHFTNVVPLNKELYSFSYVCLTAGAAALIFSAFYVLVDILGFRYLFLPLEWIGMNAMLVFVLAAEGIFAGLINGWYYEDPHNTMIYWIQKHIFIGVWHSKRVGVLLYVIFAEILFWGLVSGILHRLGIYWKL